MITTTSTTTPAEGVQQRALTFGDGALAALWTPVDTAPTALVLLGHGGGQRLDHPGITSRALSYTAHGCAVAALQAPGQGDRPRTAREERVLARRERGPQPGESMAELLADYHAEVAVLAVPEWQELLDGLRALIGGPLPPTGYWGVSFGTAVGLRLLAAEPRIGAAVLGLAGSADLLPLAAGITVPLQFWLQWDDEFVPREVGLALYDAFGSAEKTLHANVGGHLQLPRFEQQSAELFFARHLGAP